MGINKFLTVAAAAVMMSGCASIMTGEISQVQIDTSDGKKAAITIDGQDYNAPGLVTLRKAKANKTVVSKDGRCSDTILVSEVEPAFFGNILVGGLLGSSTDAGTERMWTYAEKVEINCK